MTLIITELYIKKIIFFFGPWCNRIKHPVSWQDALGATLQHGSDREYVEANSKELS